MRYAPAGTAAAGHRAALADKVELRVIDRGPGIPSSDRDEVFAPFQRLGDTDNTTGVGLGLALSRGLTEAMGGTLLPRRPPGAASRWWSRYRAPPGRGPAPTRARTPGAAARSRRPPATRRERREPRPGRRRRTADRPGPEHQPARPPLRGRHRADRRARRCQPPPRTHPTSSSSTSGSPTSTGSTSSGGCAAGPPPPSWSCPAAATAPTRSTALDAGADDYLTKPFGIDELLARMRAVSRRTTRRRRAARRHASGRQRVDLAARRVTSRDGGPAPPTSA